MGITRNQPSKRRENPKVELLGTVKRYLRTNEFEKIKVNYRRRMISMGYVDLLDEFLEFLLVVLIIIHEGNSTSIYLPLD
jgi:hypothetical protein